MIDNTRRHLYRFRCRIRGYHGWIYISKLPPDGASFDLSLLLPQGSERVAFNSPSRGLGSFGHIYDVCDNPFFNKPTKKAQGNIHG